MVSFRSASYHGAASDSFNVPRPAGVQAGDLLVAFVFGGGIPGVTGFAVQANAPAPGAARILTKIAGGSEPANYVANGLGSNGGGCAILAYSGMFDAEDLVDGAAVATVTNSETLTTSALTASGPAVVLSFFGGRNSAEGNPGAVTPAGTTERLRRTSATSTPFGWTVVAEESVDAGSTTPRSVNGNRLDNFVQAVGSLAIKVTNRPPLAPTLLGPADGATIDRNATQRFSWQFNDPDVGDTQSAYEIRYRKV